MATRATVDEFLAGRRIALIGASRDPKAFSTTILREMRAKGYQLYPVNSHADLVEGERCAHSVADLPADLDGAIVMVQSEGAADAVRECIAHGITRVWLHKGVGPSSVSDEAVQLCHEHGISLVDGACPLMFIEPTAWIHRVHRAERKVLGKLPA